MRLGSLLVAAAGALVPIVLVQAPGRASPLFRRGDANADGRIDIADPIQTLGFLFQGTPRELPCADAADCTDDGAIDISDPVRTLSYLFLGAAALPPPFGPLPSDCGSDPTPDSLDCREFAPCPAVDGPPAPPTLVPPASPTRELAVELRGTAAPGLTVAISGGAELVLTQADDDGAFSAIIPLLSNRLNRLFAVAEDSKGGASAPISVDVTQDGAPPFVHIDEPLDATTVSAESITVTGRVADLLSGFLGLGVDVNDEPAAIDIGIGTNGTFERTSVPLEVGENVIVARATDIAGNTASHEIHVTRAPLPPGADRIELVSGSGQHQRIHEELSEPIVVRAIKSDGSPLGGRVVTFRITRSDGRLALEPGLPPGGDALSLATLTDLSGLAKVYWRLGSDAGCGNNRLRVSGAGLAGTLVACASADPGPAVQINVGSGSSQRVETGAPAPERLVAWVSDGCNGIAGVPVRFTVLRGSGRVDGATETTVVTGPTGHASTFFVVGSEPGEQIVLASFPGNAGFPAQFSIYGVPRSDGAVTSFSGIVLDNASQPIGGAACGLRLRSGALLETTTQPDGTFSLDDIPESGFADLFVQGLVATSRGGVAIPPGSFPSLHFEVVLVPSAANSLPRPVLLPALDPRNARNYSLTEDTVLTVAGVEGLEMRIHAGSMRLPDGRPAPGGTTVSLNQVHADDVPMPMPDGAAPPFAWTLQPSGSRFDPPVAVTYPNMAGLPAGAVANFLSYNHDTRKFEIVSTGHVSSDASTIQSDPGSGLTLAGWGGNCPPYSVTAPVVHCSLDVTVKNPIACTGEPVEVTASAGPGPGQLRWIAPDGDPPAGAFVESEPFGSVIVNFSPQYSTPGEKTITVFWECANDVKTKVIKVKVSRIGLVRATVGHITNPSMCAGVADFSDDFVLSTSAAEDMTTNPPLAIPRGTKPVTVEARFDPAGIVPTRFKWKIRRNTLDVATGPVPAQPPRQPRFVLDTEAQGSFHVTGYCDANENDTPDAGEEKLVLNVVLVGIEVTSIAGVAHPAELVQKNPNNADVQIATGIFDFSQTNRAAAYFFATILLTGGGADATLGVDAVTVFFLQNFRGDTYRANYAGGKVGRETFVCDPSLTDPICTGTPVIMPFPVIDDDDAFPTGLTTPAAVCCHRESNLGLDARRRFVEWLDSPQFVSGATHPCGGGEAIASVAGGNSFTAYLVAFGKDAGHNYVVCAKGEWDVTTTGTIATNGAGNLVWTKDAAAGITAQATALGTPQDAAAARVMVYGPSSIGAGNLFTDGR